MTTGRIRSLGAAVLSTGLVAGSLGAAGVALAPAASAATACQSDCLSVTVTRGIESASVKLTSTASTRLSYSINPLGGANAAVNTSGAWTSSLSGFHDVLKQGTVYRWIATATDMSGVTWREVGYFSTGFRNAAVTISSVKITEDSDTGAGELMGGANVVGCGSPKDLAPLKRASATSITATWTGSSVTSFSCTGVPSTLKVQTAIADNDVDAGDLCPSPYTYTGFAKDDWYGLYSSTACHDAASTQSAVAFGLGYFAPGSATVNFTSATPASWNGSSVPVRYSVSGKVSFVQGYKSFTLPLAPAPAVVSTLPTATVGDRTATLTWLTPNLGGIAIDHFQVTRKGSDGSSATVDVPASQKSLVLAGLTNGVSYTATVYAVSAQGIGFAKSTSPAFVPRATSVLTGWDTDAVVAPYASTLSDTVQLSGSGRKVAVQFRQSGATTWTTHATLTTAGDGSLAVAYPVKAGVVEWRLSAPASSAYTAVTSDARTVTAKSRITGFSTTAKTAAVGTIIKDGITVTPGAGRTVKVQYRKTGTSTWTTYATPTASSTGSLTVSLKAKAGSYEWRVTTSASTTYGTSATTGTRTITGA